MSFHSKEEEGDAKKKRKPDGRRRRAGHLKSYRPEFPQGGLHVQDK